ncbi:protein of unknown function [Flavobacterium segetis]|uniref:DUF1543 domain-containing protein n=1 Tax=Flavobacterium segetis TaxID=271157 RepID=A0A1M5GMX2_9FLAO|nr:DUF1543 domain-containing protein [Flavobacterium segetis]SHG04901.1 protein of unknown function [Flavobacterium segetis]
MDKELKLYMILLGCKPKGRFTEQHDVFFGIGNSLKDLIPSMNLFWPEAKGQLHIDAWREVTVVDNCSIQIIPKTTEPIKSLDNLYFINLGGYKENEFEEYHYKLITVAENLASASKESKKSAFYKHCGFQGATSHIDDKYGIDVDDIYNVNEMLSAHFKEKYTIRIVKSGTTLEKNQLNIGYVKLSKLL